ncbi:hypothetical protein ISR92_00350 [Patescibacteria group bacterium]|nr:hypothetical protein [Patescibacteria group bacterium]
MFNPEQQPNIPIENKNSIENEENGNVDTLTSKQQVDLDGVVSDLLDGSFLETRSDDGFQAPWDRKRDISKFMKSGRVDFLLKNLQFINGVNHKELVSKIIEVLGDDIVLLVKYIDNFKETDHEQIAMALINANYPSVVLRSLKHFTGVDRKEFIMKTIDAGAGEYAAEFINEFAKENQKEILIRVIDAGAGKYVARHIDKVNEAYHKDIAMKLIEAGDGKSVTENFVFFKNIDTKVILKSIEVGDVKFVTSNLYKLKEVDNWEIAMKLIEADTEDGCEYVAEYLSNFRNLNHKEIAMKMVEEGKGRYVAKYLNNFKGLDHKELAIKILDMGQVMPLVEHLSLFSRLDNEIALKMIELGAAATVVRKINNFTKINYKKIALMAINAGDLGVVLNNLDKFSNLDGEVASQLISVNSMKAIFLNFDSFDNLNRESALKIIEARWASVVAENLNKFPGLDHKEIVLKMMVTDQASVVVENLNNFSGLDHKWVALKMIETDQAEFLAINLNNFSDLDRKKIALKMINAGQGSVVATHLHKFSGLDHKQIALKIIKAGNLSIDFGETLRNFSGLDKEVALELIKSEKPWMVHGYSSSFSGLDKEIAMKLIELEQSEGVADNFQAFSGLDNQVALMMVEHHAAKSVARNLDQFSGINHEEIVYRMIDAQECYALAENLNNFSGINHNEVALKILDSFMSGAVSENLGNFSSLSKEVVSRLLEDGKAEIVDKNVNSFEGDWFEKAKSYHLRPSEYYLVEDSVDESLSRDEQADKFYEILKENSDIWEDEQNIIDPFDVAKEAFGASAVFEYLDRDGLSRHDGLHNFNQIYVLYKESGLKPEQFFNNILKQVQQDDAEYEWGTAHHTLNSLAMNVNTDFGAVINDARKYPNITKLQELLDEIESPEQIFGSWKLLKKYSEINDLLKRKEILDKLQSLKVEGKEDLYRYVETLAFHPNIALKKVMDFWQDIDSFLELDDAHTPEDVQRRKKPSNYTDIPNLDLTGEELRDALIAGDYDKIQSFKSLEIEYKFGGVEAEAKPLPDVIWQAVGKRSEGIKGKAKNPNKLFSELTKLFKQSNIKLIDYLQSANVAEDFPEAELVIDQARELLLDSEIGLSSKSPRIEYRAKINKKSDPDGVVAGNDTACCMPFGSGKNNVYTFNPICSLFTIQRKTADGTWRTVAQSVLTRNIDINKNIADVVKQMTSSKVKLNELVEEDLLIDKPGIITCDNIEVAQNFSGDKAVIKDIYEDYFREYLSLYGEQDELDMGQVIVGMGYTDALTDLPTVANTFTPEAPVAYSDNLGRQAYRLGLEEEKGAKGFKKKVRRAVESDVSEGIKLPKGVKPLDFHDSLRVSYIEGKAYKDNESLIEYLHNMENALIAKDVNNAAKDRPNMSIKYEDTKGKMHGYLLSYEGKIDKNGESVIYVSDMASDGSVKAGGSLILAFTELYKKHYAEKDNMLPIYAQLRDKTSYKIINKQLDKLGKDIGVEFIMEEKGSYSQGGDTMHEVILRPKKVE